MVASEQQQQKTRAQLEKNRKMLDCRGETESWRSSYAIPYFKDEIKTNNVNQLSRLYEYDYNRTSTIIFVHMDSNPSQRLLSLTSKIPQFSLILFYHFSQKSACKQYHHFYPHFQPPTMLMSRIDLGGKLQGNSDSSTAGNESFQQ